MQRKQKADNQNRTEPSTKRQKTQHTDSSQANMPWFALLKAAEEELDNEPLKKPLPFTFPANEAPPQTLGELRERYFQKTKVMPSSQPTNNVRFFDTAYVEVKDDKGIVFKKPAKRRGY